MKRRSFLKLVALAPVAVAAAKAIPVEEVAPAAEMVECVWDPANFIGIDPELTKCAFDMMKEPIMASRWVLPQRENY